MQLEQNVNEYNSYLPLTNSTNCVLEAHQLYSK